MIYHGMFTLIFIGARGEEIRTKSSVGFSVESDDLENPRGKLRRIAYDIFSDSNACGMSVEGCLPVNSID
jgi:hypothetical protein